MVQTAFECHLIALLTFCTLYTRHSHAVGSRRLRCYGSMGALDVLSWCCSVSTSRNRLRTGRYRAVPSLSIARLAPALLVLSIRATGLVGYSWVCLSRMVFVLKGLWRAFRITAMGGCLVVVLLQKPFRLQDLWLSRSSTLVNRHQRNCRRSRMKWQCLSVLCAFDLLFEHLLQENKTLEHSPVHGLHQGA